jgi:UDP-2,3-diacylglucosamine hydrolase
VPGTCFISDLHLDPARPDVTATLAAFLQEHTDLDALYILGDLFEAWIGDDDDAALATSTAAALRAFSDAGPALYLMQGNRDFMLGRAFCQRAGATLLDDPTVIELYGEPTLLMHGDSLCTADKEYQAFRTQARDPGWQAEMLSRPLPERRALAADLRRISRDAAGNKPEDIVDVSLAEVNRVMAEHTVTRLIHGHTHRPARHTEAGGVRWVLGDWGETAWVVRADDARIELVNLIK